MLNVTTVLLSFVLRSWTSSTLLLSSSLSRQMCVHALCAGGVLCLCCVWDLAVRGSHQTSSRDAVRRIFFPAITAHKMLFWSGIHTPNLWHMAKLSTMYSYYQLWHPQACTAWKNTLWVACLNDSGPCLKCGCRIWVQKKTWKRKLYRIVCLFQS